jgi:hypothetical protein
MAPSRRNLIAATVGPATSCLLPAETGAAIQDGTVRPFRVNVPEEEILSMIYELRVYQPVPGQMPKLLARFRDHTVPIWKGLGIRPLGFWTTLIGESSNELTYILSWESLGEREAKWAEFQNDPAWHKARDDSERDGPIVASIRNQILTPTAFSALK